MIKLIVSILLLFIVLSLGSALFSLLRNKGRGTVKALTMRIVLSIIAFAILLLGYTFGLIEPRGQIQ